MKYLRPLAIIVGIVGFFYLGNKNTLGMSLLIISIIMMTIDLYITEKRRRPSEEIIEAAKLADIDEHTFVKHLNEKIYYYQWRYFNGTTTFGAHCTYTEYVLATIADYRNGQLRVITWVKGPCEEK